MHNRQGGTGVAKREWGAKHTCTACGVKFYDLHRRPIKCPKCGIEIEVATVRPNRRRPPAQPEPPPLPAPPANDDEVAVGAVEEATDDDDDVIDDIDDGADDLVESIDKGEPAQAESEACALSGIP